VKRICAEYQIVVSELWTYTMSFDQVRFALVHRSPDAPVVKIPAAKPAKPAPILRQAQSRPEQGRGTKAGAPSKPQSTVKAKLGPTNGKPAAKPKPAAQAKAKAQPVAKAKAKTKPAAKAAKKARR
jgi:hypothetical protein